MEVGLIDQFGTMPKRENMKVKYALHPGLINSKNDGDRHFIDAHTLARLYRVSPRECVVVPSEAPLPGREREREMLLDRIQRMDVLHLYPDYHGNYTLPNANSGTKPVA